MIHGVLESQIFGDVYENINLDFNAVKCFDMIETIGIFHFVHSA